MEIKGVYTPVITIMDDAGAIDLLNMEKHINHLVEAGINGLLFFGSLGEFYAFSKEEKKDSRQIGFITNGGNDEPIK